jgi:hypothetical protein
LEDWLAAMSLPPFCQSRRESSVAAAGPPAFVLTWLATSRLGAIMVAPAEGFVKRPAVDPVGPGRENARRYSEN